jgi:hypothetical protein
MAFVELQSLEFHGLDEASLTGGFRTDWPRISRAWDFLRCQRRPTSARRPAHSSPILGVGLLQKLVESLAANAGKLSFIRDEFDALPGPYCADNYVRQDRLVTRTRDR